MKEIKIIARAFDDLTEIESYSVDTWGSEVAEKYLNDIAVGLKLIQENSGLLQNFEGFSASLKYYRVKNHFIICTETDEYIFLLTIKHVQMDIIKLLSKLEPTLASEVELLSHQLSKITTDSS